MLYYIALFLITDVRAVKSNLKGLPKESLPNVKDAVFKRGYHGLPLLFLIVMIIAGWSPMRAAFWASILAMLVGLVSMRNAKKWFGKLIEALYDASKQTVPIAVACAGAGIIVGVVTLTAATLFKAVNGGLAMVQTYGWPAMVTGFVCAALSAAVAVQWMVGYLNRHSFSIFGCSSSKNGLR